ncbi:hypothetical protein HHE06_03890 [Helicobacter heilmannii]|nr:hypothetical protein BN341_15380 [Helicobacter heilmannii ASB1.4]CRF50551.1 hypothetical protein HHE06_03890 [Helicobacter heilmannii]
MIKGFLRFFALGESILNFIALGANYPPTGANMSKKPFNLIQGI